MEKALYYAQQALAEEKASLEQFQRGEGIPPWGNKEQAISECEARIASIQAKLDDPDKLQDWWDSIPVEAKESWENT